MIFLISSAISPQEAIAQKQIRAAIPIRSEGLSAKDSYYDMSDSTYYEYLISYLADSGKRFLEAIASTAKLAKTFARRSRDHSDCNLGKSLAIVKKILRSASALSEGEALPQLEASVHIHLKAKKPGTAIAGFLKKDSEKGTLRVGQLIKSPMTLVYPTKFPQTGRSVLFSKDFSEKAIAPKLTALIEQQRLTDCMVALEEYGFTGEQAIATLAHLQSLEGAS